MPKRSYEDKINHYLKKVEKLKSKYAKRRKISTSSSSDIVDTFHNQDVEVDTWDQSQVIHEPDAVEMTPVVVPECSEEPAELQNDLPAVEPAVAPAAAPAAPTLNGSSNEPVHAADDSAFPTLDPDVLAALGEATDQGPTYGENIHTNLTQLWDPLLKNGMSKEVKDKLLKQYLIPNNCKLLQAPRLNIEISAAVAEMVRLRDKKVETNQQQLGVGITVMSRAMTSLMTTESKMEAIKTLSDGCRILCDLHYLETKARIKMITPGLAKPFLNVIQDSERDETLFGTSLPEKIKASKTIEKQGLQIKKTAPPPRTYPVATQAAGAPARPQYQGNWSGPPRYPTSRGGRAAARRFPSYSRRPTSAAAAAAAATTQPRGGSGRSRAPPRN